MIGYPFPLKRKSYSFQLFLSSCVCHGNIFSTWCIFLIQKNQVHIYFWISRSFLIPSPWITDMLSEGKHFLIINISFVQFFLSKQLLAKIANIWWTTTHCKVLRASFFYKQESLETWPVARLVMQPISCNFWCVRFLGSSFESFLA